MGNTVESHVTRCIGSLDRHERAYVARAVAWHRDCDGFQPPDQRSEIGILAATQSIVVGGIEIVRVLSYASDASK